MTRPKVLSSLVKEVLYAVDCNIVTHSEDEMQRFYEINMIKTGIIL